MAFAARFNEVTTDITHISELEVNMKYPTERADRITMRFGDTVLLSIRDTAADRLHKVFLPQRYGAVFKDSDLQPINEGSVDLWLVSKGKCPKTNAYQLAVEKHFSFQIDMAGVIDLVTSSIRLLFTYR